MAHPLGLPRPCAVVGKESASMSKPLKVKEVAAKLTNGQAKDLAKEYIAMMRGIQKAGKEHTKAMRDYVTKYNKAQKAMIEAIMTKNKQDTDELQAIIEVMTEDKRLEGKLKHVYERLDKVARSRAKAEEWAEAEMPELPEFVKTYDEEVPIKGAIKMNKVIVHNDDVSSDDEDDADAPFKAAAKPMATGASSSGSFSSTSTSATKSVATFKAAPKVAKSSMQAAIDGAAGVPADFKRPSAKAPAAPQAQLDDLGF